MPYFYQLIGVEPCGRFIEYKNFGVVNKRRSQAYTLAIAFGERLYLLIAFRRKPCKSNYLFNPIGGDFGV